MKKFLTILRSWLSSAPRADNSLGAPHDAGSPGLQRPAVCCWTNRPPPIGRVFKNLWDFTSRIGFISILSDAELDYFYISSFDATLGYPGEGQPRRLGPVPSIIKEVVGGIPVIGKPIRQGLDHIMIQTGQTANHKGDGPNGRKRKSRKKKSRKSRPVKSVSFGTRRAIRVPAKTMNRMKKATQESFDSWSSGAPAATEVFSRAQKPRVRMSNHPDGGIIISHAEPVTAVTPINTFTITGNAINAGNSFLFQGLSRIAPAFKSYRFRKLKFCYRGSCTTGSTGSVTMCFEDDAGAGAPSSEVNMLTMPGGCNCAVYSSIDTGNLPFAVRKARNFQLININNILETGMSYDDYDAGQFFYATQGGNSGATAYNTGIIWACYTVELVDWNAGTTDAFWALLTTPLTDTSNVAQILTQSSNENSATAYLNVAASGNIATFRRNFCGYMIFTMDISGSPSASTISMSFTNLLGASATVPLDSSVNGVYTSTLGNLTYWAFVYALGGDGQFNSTTNKTSTVTFSVSTAGGTVNGFDLRFIPANYQLLAKIGTQKGGTATPIQDTKIERRVAHLESLLNQQLRDFKVSEPPTPHPSGCRCEDCYEPSITFIEREDPTLARKLNFHTKGMPGEGHDCSSSDPALLCGGRWCISKRGIRVICPCEMPIDDAHCSPPISAKITYCSRYCYSSPVYIFDSDDLSHYTFCDRCYVLRSSDYKFAWDVNDWTGFATSNPLLRNSIAAFIGPTEGYHLCCRECPVGLIDVYPEAVYRFLPPELVNHVILGYIGWNCATCPQFINDLSLVSADPPVEVVCNGPLGELEIDSPYQPDSKTTFHVLGYPGEGHAARYGSMDRKNPERKLNFKAHRHRRDHERFVHLPVAEQQRIDEMNLSDGSRSTAINAAWNRYHGSAPEIKRRYPVREGKQREYGLPDHGRVRERRGRNVESSPSRSPPPRHRNRAPSHSPPRPPRRPPQGGFPPRPFGGGGGIPRAPPHPNLLVDGLIFPFFNPGRFRLRIDRNNWPVFDNNWVQFWLPATTRSATEQDVTWTIPAPIVVEKERGKEAHNENNDWTCHDYVFDPSNDTFDLHMNGADSLLKVSYPNYFGFINRNRYFDYNHNLEWTRMREWGPFILIRARLRASRDMRPKSARGDVLEPELMIKPHLGNGLTVERNLLNAALLASVPRSDIDQGTAADANFSVMKLVERLNIHDPEAAFNLAQDTVTASMIIRRNAKQRSQPIVREHAYEKSGDGFTKPVLYDDKGFKHLETTAPLWLHFVYLIVINLYCIIVAHYFAISSWHAAIPFTGMACRTLTYYLEKKLGAKREWTILGFTYWFVTVIMAPIGEESLKLMAVGFIPPVVWPLSFDQPAQMACVLVTTFVLSTFENYCKRREKWGWVWSYLAHFGFAIIGFYATIIHMAWNFNVYWIGESDARFLALGPEIIYRTAKDRCIPFLTEYRISPRAKVDLTKVTCPEPKEVAWLYGVGAVDVTPEYPKKCTHNAFNALVDRHVKHVLYDDEPAVITRTWYATWPLFVALAAAFSKHALTWFSFLHWKRRYTLPLRLMYEKFVNTFGDFKIDRNTFIKFEAYAKFKTPRLIQGLSEFHKVFVGPLTAHLTKILAKIDVFGIVYTGGCDQDELARRWRDNWETARNRFHDPVVVETDISRFDASVSPPCFRMFHRFMLLLGIARSVMRIFDELIKKVGTIKGVRYSTTATMDSGHGYTTLMNTVLNMIMCVSIYGRTAVGFVAGDDSLVFCDRSQAKGLEEKFKLFGFIAKIKIHDSFLLAEYCSLIIVPTLDGYTCIPKPFRYLFKYGWSKTRLNSKNIKLYRAALWHSARRYRDLKMYRRVAPPEFEGTPVARFMRMIENPHVHPVSYRLIRPCADTYTTIRMRYNLSQSDVDEIDGNYGTRYCAKFNECLSAEMA